MKPSTLQICLLLTAASLAALDSPILQAASRNTAKNFMKGGTFCFMQGEPLPGANAKTVKLVVGKATGGSPYKLAHVDALLRGVKATLPLRTYVDEATGSATIASPNDGMSGPSQVHIALTGTSYGADGDVGKPGIWFVTYAVTLSTSDLTGRIVGFSEFTRVPSGESVESVRYATDEALSPVPCSEFAP